MKNFRKGKLTEQEIHQWLLDLRGNPNVPESGFDVTAVFRAKVNGVDDYYFAGVNVENADHRLGTHGEEGCISNIVTALGKYAEITEGWVMGSPRGLTANDDHPLTDLKCPCCGKCRQQVAGLAGEDVQIHSFSLKGDKDTTTVRAFLPNLFTFRQYIPELVTAQSGNSKVAPTAEEVEKKLIRKGPLSEQEISEWIKELESVDYASKISQSAIIRLSNGYYVAGTKVEEAAFVDISAAQAALAVATSEFGPSPKVEEVWVYTKGREEKALPKNTYGTLPMSALQTLNQVAENVRIPLHYLNDDGIAKTTTLAAAASIAATSARPLQKVRAKSLQR